MSIAKPGASIIHNGNTLTAAEAGLLSVRIDLGLSGHDRVYLHFWPNSVLSRAAPGDELSISLSNQSTSSGLGTATLGAGEDGDTLWTGTIQSAQRSSQVNSLEGLSSSFALSDIRRSETWEDMSVADIVGDLAGELSTQVEADLQLSSFSIDNTRTVWSYLHELAQLAGAELSCAGDGGIRFVLASKQSQPMELHYGAELLDWQLSHNISRTAIGGAEHGAASSAGGDKWHWLAHDPIGEGGDAVCVPAAFRTRDSAEAFSKAANARAERARTSGNVWLGGRPDLRPGNWVKLIGLPEGDSDSLRVKTVTHQLDAYSGFLTALHVEGGGGGNGL